MRSAYPSSQSFFDATSDSIRAEDVDKCRSSASFSSLADLFTNPSCKSDLFPNARAPVFVPEEVRFPAKKKRECEERTSIWHEWGSGECQSENVAEESSGFTTALIRGCKSSILSSSTFPNLGSANVSLLTEEFTFPARKKREEGSSWREERTSWQDWSTSAPPKDTAAVGSSPIVGSIKDMYLSKPCTKPFDFRTSSKSSPFSSLGAPAKSASEEVSFPARKKREERSFWQESSLDGSTQPDCEVMATPRDRVPGVGALADMYLRKAGSKCSNLFSKAVVSSTEEVVFPKRRVIADRNAWRDWTNTGYGDCDDDAEGDGFCIENSSPPTAAVVTEADGSEYPKVAPPCSVEGSNRFCVTENSPASECVLRSSVHELDSGTVGLIQSLSSEVQICEAVSAHSNGLVRNVDESGCPDQQVEGPMDREEVFDATEDMWIAGDDENEARCINSPDREEVFDATEDIWIEGDDENEARCINSPSEQRSRSGTMKYPPPLGSLSRQGQSRVPNHMPWVQLQPIRSEGRFVLQEVKVTQPVVFQPIRKEGRLLLQLIGQQKRSPKGDVGARHHGSGLVGDKKSTLVPSNMISNESVIVKTETEAKVVVKKTDGTQALDHAKRRDETERTKKSSKFWPSVIALSSTDRKKSAKVFPVDCTPCEEQPGEEILFARSDEAGMREFCYMADEIISSSDCRGSGRERIVALEGALIPDRPPLWLLGKLSPEGRKFDARKSLHSVSQVRNAVDRLGQNGNVITIHRPRENAPLRLHFQTLPRSSSLRNGLSGLNGSRGDGECNLTRSKSIRSSSLSDVSALGPRTEEKASDSVRGRAQESRPPLSVYQGIIRDSFLSFTTGHSFLRSLRPRADIPGEPDPRVSNCKPSVVSVFSCADGVGNRHHEKNFWEQQPCVS